MFGIFTGVVALMLVLLYSLVVYSAVETFYTSIKKSISTKQWNIAYIGIASIASVVIVGSVCLVEMLDLFIIHGWFA